MLHFEGQFLEVHLQIFTAFTAWERPSQTENEITITVFILNGRIDGIIETHGV
jgi:hypothetical protein